MAVSFASLVEQSQLDLAVSIDELRNQRQFGYLILTLDATVLAVAIAGGFATAQFTLGPSPHIVVFAVAMWIAGATVIGASTGLIFTYLVLLASYRVKGTGRPGHQSGIAASSLLADSTVSHTTAYQRILITYNDRATDSNWVTVDEIRAHLRLAFALPWYVGTPMGVAGVLRILVFRDGIPFFPDAWQAALPVLAVAAISWIAWQRAKAIKGPTEKSTKRRCRTCYAVIAVWAAWVVVGLILGAIAAWRGSVDAQVNGSVWTMAWIVAIVGSVALLMSFNTIGGRAVFWSLVGKLFSRRD